MNDNMPFEKTEMIDLKDLFHKCLKNKYWFVISVFVFFFAWLLYAKTTNAEYEVKSAVLIRNLNEGAAAHRAFLEGLGVREMIKVPEDEIQILLSKLLMQQVILSLDVQTEYYEKQGLRWVELYKVSPLKLRLPEGFTEEIGGPVRFFIKQTKEDYAIEIKSHSFSHKYHIQTLDETIKTSFGLVGFELKQPLDEGKTYKVVVYPLDALAEKYAKSLKAEVVTRQSNIISVSMRTATPEKTRVILDKLVDLYQKEGIEEKNRLGISTFLFINDRISLLEQELDIIEMDLESFKQKNGIVDFVTESELFLQSANEYERRRSEIDTQISLVLYIDEYVRMKQNEYNLIPSNLGIEERSLLVLIDEYNRVLIERMKLLKQTKTEDSVLEQMEVTLSVLRSNIITSITSVLAGFDIAKNAMGKIEGQFKEKIKKLPTLEREFIEKKRHQETKQSLYLYLLKRKQENELNLTATMPSSRVLEPAYFSSGAVASRKITFLAIAMLIAILIPLLGCCLVMILSGSISGKKEFLSLVKAPFLASIGKSKTNGVVVKDACNTPIIEMFRLLRMNLLSVLSKEKKSHVILLTSSINGEGKSFVSLNLALSLALMRKRVVLVDCDLRSDKFNVAISSTKDTIGVAGFLENSSVKLNKIVKKTLLNENLSVLQAGTAPLNPTELLMSSRLDEMIDGLREEFDYILLDSAPVAFLSDTYELNRVLDNTIYIARESYTSKDFTELINEIYEEKKLKNMTVVLNGTTENLNSYRGDSRRK